MRRLQTVKLLAFNDLGQKPATDYASDRLETLIDARDELCLPTIVTMNQPPEKVSEKYPRQMSRLSRNIVLHVLGPDGRKR